MLFTHPALPGLHAAKAAPRRSLKSWGKQAIRGHINKAGSSPSVPAAATLAAEAPLPALCLPRARRGRRINGRAVSVQAPPEVPAPSRASADPRLPGGERRTPAAREVPPRSAAGARVPVGAHGRREPTPPRGRAALPRRCRRPGCAGAAASVAAAASEGLVGSGRDRASGPASKLSLTLPRGPRGPRRVCTGRGLGADGAALGGLPGGGAPRRPPRQRRQRDRALQRIIAARDISADTIPARGRGGAEGGRGGGRHCSGPRGPAGLARRPLPRRPLPFPGQVPPNPGGRTATPAGRSDGARAPSRPGSPRPLEGTVP